MAYQAPPARQFSPVNVLLLTLLASWPVGVIMARDWARKARAVGEPAGPIWSAWLVGGAFNALLLVAWLANR